MLHSLTAAAALTEGGGQERNAHAEPQGQTASRQEAGEARSIPRAVASATSAKRRSTRSTTRTSPPCVASSATAARSSRRGSPGPAAVTSGSSPPASSAPARWRCCRTSPRARVWATAADAAARADRALPGNETQRRVARDFSCVFQYTVSTGLVGSRVRGVTSRSIVVLTCADGWRVGHVVPVFLAGQKGVIHGRRYRQVVQRGQGLRLHLA